MPIRYIAWVAARPVFLPMLTIGAGFWFGTADITYKISCLVIQPPAKLGRTCKNLSLLGGVTAGSSIYIFRHIIQSPPTFMIPMEISPSGSIFGTVRAGFTNFFSSIKSLKNFPVRYYALTTVTSAMLAGVTTAILQKNIGGTSPPTSVPVVAKIVQQSDATEQ